MVGLSLPFLGFLPWEGADQPASFHFYEKILLLSCVSIPLSEDVMYELKFTLLNMSRHVPLPLWWWGCHLSFVHESWPFIAFLYNLFSLGEFFSFVPQISSNVPWSSASSITSGGVQEIMPINHCSPLPLHPWELRHSCLGWGQTPSS